MHNAPFLRAHYPYANAAKNSYANQMDVMHILFDLWLHVCARVRVSVSVHQFLFMSIIEAADLGVNTIYISDNVGCCSDTRAFFNTSAIVYEAIYHLGA